MFRSTPKLNEVSYYDPLNHFSRDLLKTDFYDQIPVPFDTLLYDKRYLNLPKLSQPQYNFLYYLSDINPQTCQYTRAFLEWGKGSGKDWISAQLGLIISYKLLCISDPYRFFLMPSDSHIDLLNVAYSAFQAENVYFEYLTTKLEQTEMFDDFGSTRAGRNCIRFPKNINFYSGHSDQESWEGLNLFFAFADEISAFEADKEKRRIKRSAPKMWEMIDDSVDSRFPEIGKAVAASFPRYQKDYIEQLIEMAKAINAKRAAEGKKIYFWTSFGSTWDINLSKSRSMYDRKYELNPELARAKYECYPPMMVDAFYRYPEKVDNCISKAMFNPLDAMGRFRPNFVGNPLFNYYVGLDLSKNRDATGLVMGHVHEYNGYNQPVLHYDLIKRYVARPGQEINFDGIRQDIYALQRRNFRIKLVSMDGYQSVDFMQILNKKRIKTALFSLDRDMKGHDTQKALIYDGRAKYYGDGDAIHFMNELKTLQLIQGRKVDHPEGGSKDLADAGAGMAYHACLDRPSSVGVDELDW